MSLGLRMLPGENNKISNRAAFGVNSLGWKNGESGLYAEERRMIVQIAIASHRITHFPTHLG